MTRSIPLVLLGVSLCGCGVAPVKQEPHSGAAAAQSVAPAPSHCVGTVGLPPQYANAFEAVVDEPLLKRALGQTDKGGLCQGTVYKSKKTLPVYRAWNSTNPRSRLGNWWAFNRPAGRTAAYRDAYEICYQWSPLDQLTRCTLKKGARLVVGTGQSAYCDGFLTYPVSPAKQIYIAIDPDSPAVSDCVDYDGFFNWKRKES
ncbi:hypothetical protein [uncultured Thiodictyon sp.]|uniref:hypothetical protein n=1 Tax=uncultured Thiodictyon sp. TaxID=1846217 RepID=UPI0025FBF349|nr:hypothetical protein [uncultured Thiodictyon sp.]